MYFWVLTPSFSFQVTPFLFILESFFFLIQFPSIFFLFLAFLVQVFPLITFWFFKFLTFLPSLFSLVLLSTSTIFVVIIFFFVLIHFIFMTISWFLMQIPKIVYFLMRYWNFLPIFFYFHLFFPTSILSIAFELPYILASCLKKT